MGDISISIHTGTLPPRGDQRSRQPLWVVSDLPLSPFFNSVRNQTALSFGGVGTSHTYIPDIAQRVLSF